MPHYMSQVSYTGEALKAQIDTTQDRQSHIRALIEAAGGELHSWFYAFGEYDLIVIYEAPDHVSAASVLLAAASSGAGKIATTALMTADEGVEAMRRAKQVSYTPPA
jgi:uncharacterized protein with GYD domain